MRAPKMVSAVGRSFFSFGSDVQHPSSEQTKMPFSWSSESLDKVLKYNRFT